ncbi:hypothetical protein FZEAL_1942 [Fusarium zealandicum]|uniref:O-methyltransferase C-terminal domain-containing protein n=1 Tax=Fusarium zealandicum TaxID=1053134 RepID=A0A8H4URR6_9HYPO|nr:hypothetical protein FZEAL_1942 [Fusarium zealandicum]
MDPRDILPVARDIAKEAETLSQLLGENAAHQLWGHPPHGSEIEKSQSKLLGLAQKLDRSLRGPHDFLHELVASNWDKGAIYCLLERGVLDSIPLNGEADVTQLSKQSGIPEEKLLPMLRLAACEQILCESAEHVFCHGPISRELLADPGLKAFIGFQLSIVIDAIRWGQSMYDWHKTHPEKGDRFAAAMKSVASALDPGNQLLENWFSENDVPQDTVVDIVRMPGITSQFLSDKFPSLQFKVQELPKDLTRFALDTNLTDAPQVYVLKSVLWNLSDQDCNIILKELLTCLKKSPDSIILINDLLSPPPDMFEPHVNKAYRRRDVTVMTMHNAKLRTEMEWISIFREAIPSSGVSLVPNLGQYY